MHRSRGAGSQASSIRMRRAPLHNPRAKSKGDLMSRPPITIVLTVRDRSGPDGDPGATVDAVVLNPSYDAVAHIDHVEPADEEDLSVSLSLKLAPWHQLAIPESLRAVRG